MRWHKLLIGSGILLCINLAFSQPAYAYLDPGTGSVLLQGLLAGFAGFIAVLKLYWQRVKRFFILCKNKLLGKSVTQTTSDINLRKHD